MGEGAPLGVDHERLSAWAADLGLAVYGTTDQLQMSVERALAVKYFDEDAEVLDCGGCGFSCPRVEDLPECPGCGLEFAAPNGPKEDRMSNVVSMKQKEERRQEERESRSANEKTAERKKKTALEKIEKKIDELVQDAGCIEWDIGKHLNEIYEKDLWQVTGEHTSFNDYATGRFDFTRQTATAFMRIAEVFSREEASEIPLGHLRLLIKVPDDETRRQLVDQVKKDSPTFRELADTVKAKRAEAGLNTSRAGMEDSVLLNVRLRNGVVAEAEWVKGETKAAKRSAFFKLGEVELRIDDHGDDGLSIVLPE